MTMIATRPTGEVPAGLTPALASVADRVRRFSDGHRLAAQALRRQGDEVASLREDALADAAAAACWSIENGGACSPQSIVASLKTPPSSLDPVAFAQGRDFVVAVLERALPGGFVFASAGEDIS